MALYGLAEDPPEIIKKPQNQGVRVGGVASFYCAARGDPPPSIVWRKNGKKVSGTQSRYTVLEQTGGVSILRIEPVRAGRDDAPYECVAENGVGDAVSADATLTVYEGVWLAMAKPYLMVDFRPLIDLENLVWLQTLIFGNKTSIVGVNDALQ
uniref:Ig-like domain-containing protein n=1 Tax=Glossina palpalis gambiensis TaxID=67801 RepID=A0A1B0BHD6_9MUSC